MVGNPGNSQQCVW